jgi:hypothetical protein
MMQKYKLSAAQQRMVNYLFFPKILVQSVVDNTLEWRYNFIKPVRGLVFRNGVMEIDEIYELCKPHSMHSQRTIKCLIDKKVLITKISDKEFNMQLALGTMDCRIYTLAERYFPYGKE